MKTNEQRNAEARNVLKGMAEFLGALKSRWADEREYENFADYIDVVFKKVKELGGTPVKLTKNFELAFKIDEYVYNLRTNKHTIIMEIPPAMSVPQ